MNDNKKFIIANRCSSVLFAFYILTYIILPIYAKDARYLIFLIIPVMVLIGLLVNLLLKYDELNTNKLGKFVKVIAILNVLFNGNDAVAGSAFASEIDWEAKKELTKKYPSIEPVQIFVIIVTTILCNPAFGLLWGLNLNLILKCSVISLSSLILCQITSSFSVYYKNGKKELWGFWRTIIIFVLLCVLVFGLTGGFKMISDEYNNKKEQEELQEHIDNINEALEKTVK